MLLEYTINMSSEGFAHASLQTVRLILGTLLCATFLVPHVNANPERQRSQGDPGLSLARSPAITHSTARDNKSTPESNSSIPPGTILPVRLNPTLSSAKCKKGQLISGRIMQDVPLSSGVRIKEGSKVLGHIVEVIPATTSAGARISLQFDELVSAHQKIRITTNLRAIAGFMQVLEAETPTISPGESDVFPWLTTVQVGGDVVYGEGGVVTTREGPNQIVGKAVAGGVLGKARAKDGTKCRGSIDGNDAPQALWIFSSDACGAYGLEHINIAHAGRTDPTGVIVLTAASGNLKLPGGAGLLLRVNANRRN